MAGSTFWIVFSTVFLAELGDKTQVATLLFSSQQNVSRLAVFVGSSLALVLASGIGVLVGGQLEKFVSPRTLNLFGAIGFLAVGVWSLYKVLRPELG